MAKPPPSRPSLNIKAKDGHPWRSERNKSKSTQQAEHETMTKGTKRVHQEDIQAIEFIALNDVKREPLIDEVYAQGEVPPTRSRAQSDPIILSNLDIIDVTDEDPVLSLFLQC